MGVHNHHEFEQWPGPLLSLHVPLLKSLVPRDLGSGRFFDLSKPSGKIPLLIHKIRFVLYVSKVKTIEFTFWLSVKSSCP